MIKRKTGLVVDAYFSGTKLAWLLKNVRKTGKLAFGTVDSWLVWNLTGGRVLVTDPSNASRTMLFNLRTGDWDDELLKLFGVPRSVLPHVGSSSEVYGETTLFGGRVPIAGIAGDQQAALFGQACTQPGMVKNTYGTGCFMLMNTGTKPIASKNNLLTTVAWRIGHRTGYALEGSIFIAGAVVQWLRDGLGIIQSSSEVEALASQVDDTAGVYLVPAFAGLGAPHWDQYARGLLAGVTRGTTAAHIARAALEGIAFQVADVLRAKAADAKIKLKELRVDGGAAGRRRAQHQAECRGRHGDRVHATRPLSGAGAAAPGGAGRLLPRDDVQPRRIRRPARESSAELPLLHGRPLLPAREHPPAQHQHSLGDDQQLPRLLPVVRGAHRRMRWDRPADPGHRLGRPHRVQRAGELPELADAAQDAVQADHRRQRPLLRAPRGCAGLCDHDGRRDHPRCAQARPGRERQDEGRKRSARPWRDRARAW